LWENPEIQEINRLPMRSPLLPFASEAAAVTDVIAGPEYRNLEKNELYQSLDGKWRFQLLENPMNDCRGPDQGDKGGIPGWAAPGFDVENWPLIQVPGAWSLQGYDKPHYTNIQMPFQGTPPRAPEHNPTGLYRRIFTVPPAWKDRRVVLRLGSAESCLLVYVNGFFAGAGKDTRLPQEFDITPFLKENENVLCLKVVRYSDASYVEDQDQWWFGGILRSVFIYAAGMCCIKDVKALPGAAAGCPGGRKGTLHLAVTLGGKLPEGQSTGNEPVHHREHEDPFTIKYRLYPFALPSGPGDPPRIAARLLQSGPLVSGDLSLDCDFRLNANTVETEFTLDNPELWSHENPNLYILSVSLYLKETFIESAAFCTAFRTVEVADRELRINGRAVLIKGVNRHEHDEHTGKTLSTESMVRDIALLKTHNFNAVRTCHYPDDERWYELCDRYGIYLVDEANIESHCFYDQLCRDTAWSFAFMSRIQRMAERDKNHPSVIVWSLGNESGFGPSHDMGAAWLRRYDSSRPLHYEGAIRPKSGGPYTLDTMEEGRNVTDIIGPMYPPIKLITDFAKYRDDYRPLIMIEYSHAMGNSNGSLSDYWKAIESYHGLQGGFIWDWIDQGIAAYTADGVKYWKYGGDFGDEPTDYDFCLNGLLFPDQRVKPAMAECKQLFAPVRLNPVDGRPFAFTVENRFDFSGLDTIRLRWKLYADDAVLAEEERDLPPLAPGASGDLQFPVPEQFDPLNYGGVLYIHADFRLKTDTPWAQAGFVISSGERIIRESLPPMTASGTEGELAGFAGLFTPSLFRAPTENDGLKTYKHLRGDPAAAFYYQDKAMYYWLDLDLLHMRLEDEKRETLVREGCAVSRYTAALRAGEHAAGEFRNVRLGTYTSTIVPSDGVRPLVMEIAFDLDPSLPELPKAGVTARIPAYYEDITWFGAGPQESYPDRRTGVFLGRYTGSVKELETPYIVPQENGNRSGVRYVTLAGKNIPPGQPKTLTIRSAEPFFFSASRYEPENLLNALHTPDLLDVTLGEGGYYLLNIDCAQRGVGSAACGPDTLEEYRVRPGIFRMKLFFF
jgi:beta-galactosidase